MQVCLASLGQHKRVLPCNSIAQSSPLAQAFSQVWLPAMRPLFAVEISAESAQGHRKLTVSLDGKDPPSSSQASASSSQFSPAMALSHQLSRPRQGRIRLQNSKMYGNRQSDGGRARFRLQEGTPQTPETVPRAQSEKDIMPSTTLILAAALFAALADAAPTPLRMVRRGRKCPEGGPSHPILVPLRRWGFLRRWPLRWLPQWQKEAVAL